MGGNFFEEKILGRILEILISWLFSQANLGIAVNFANMIGLEVPSQFTLRYGNYLCGSDLVWGAI